MHAHHLHRGSELLALLRPCLRQHLRQRQRIRLKLPHSVHPARSFSAGPRVGATHNGMPKSSLLSQALDQRQQAARGAQADTAGPFTLGMTRQSLGEGKKLKKWNELSTKGKMVRTTARTTNFTVIIFGAGLTAVLAYALASELFARNSPTVLYGEACERIGKSEKITDHLPGPLTFHNNPPSSARPRHRNRHVSSQLVVDSSGREHLLLNFYARAAAPGSSSGSFFADDGHLARARDALRSLGEGDWSVDWDLDAANVWVHEQVRIASERARQLFLYLTGEAGSSLTSSSSSYSLASGSNTSPGGALSPLRKETHIGRSEGGGGLWASVTGLFSGIGKGISGEGLSSSSGRAKERGELFEEGEVHCDLVKDDDGNFVWRYIIVDMPNSRARYPNRVFVERASGVRDNEAVMRWT
ncbi:hypothetical protein M0805_008299 [Coniferiporia weirii]|nr:hypothetical protein M0805_008299 [Coniferiporia weirii]